MRAAELIDQALVATNATSRRQLAEITGLDHTMLSLWANEKRPMTADAALILAHVAGLPAGATAAKIRAHLEQNQKMRALLSKIAGTAAALLLCAYSQSGECHSFTDVSFDIKDTEYTYATLSR